jgi:large subunit ribosomal protein L9e
VRWGVVGGGLDKSSDILLFIIYYSYNIIMKFILAEQVLDIPEGVNVEVKSREVTVKGKLGTLTRKFKHTPIEIVKETNDKKASSLKFKMWLQKKKRNAAIGTIKSIIRNMITGVSVGYKFKMVLAYSHFPIVANVIENGRVPPPLPRPSKSKTSWASR